MALWRLLTIKEHDAFENMAIDEAVLHARTANSVPSTLRLYQWNPSAVSIGRFQNIETEVQIENCKLNKVDVVRRITGGGTVYHDSKNEITYSVIASYEDLNTDDITTAYARVYAGIAEALRILGITTDFDMGDAKTCPNLTVNRKKISGSAQHHRKRVVLQHGTLLMDVDLRRMFTLIRTPWAQTCMQVVEIAKNKITSVKQELGKTLTPNEVQQALIKGFQETLRTQVVQSTLTPDEQEHAKKLAKEKYATRQWNLKGKSPFD